MNRRFFCKLMGSAAAAGAACVVLPKPIRRWCDVAYHRYAGVGVFSEAGLHVPQYASIAAPTLLEAELIVVPFLPPSRGRKR